MSEHTSESALTTDTPTPCRPPETLQPLCSPPNLPPACSTYTTDQLPFVLLTFVCQRIWETILHLYSISQVFQSQTINCNNIAACLIHRHQPDNQKFFTGQDLSGDGKSGSNCCQEPSKILYYTLQCCNQQSYYGALCIIPCTRKGKYCTPVP